MMRKLHVNLSEAFGWKLGVSAFSMSVSKSNLGLALVVQKPLGSHLSMAVRVLYRICQAQSSSSWAVT